MEQTTVKELATEFGMKGAAVTTELKKIGVWVPSPTTPLDADIANRIRKRLQVIVEAAQDDKDKKGDKGKKAAVATKARRSIKDLGKTPKRAGAHPVEEPAKEAPAPTLLTGAMAPRKGRRTTYLKMEAMKEDHVPVRTELEIGEELPQEEVAAVAAAPGAETSEVKEAAAIPEAAVAAEMAEAPAAAEAPTVEAAPEEAVVAAPVSEEPVVPEPEPKLEVPAAVAVTPEAKPVPEIPPAVSTPQPVREQPAAPVVVAPKPEIAPVKEEETAEEERPQRIKSSMARKKQKKEKEKAKPGPARKEEPSAAAGPREVFFSEKVTVKSFAELTGTKGNEVIGFLFQKGLAVNMNQLLDQETIELLCARFQVTPKFGTFEEAAAMVEKAEERPEDLVSRAPVVTVMGHVDHGKTTLLDLIRKTRVADAEAGGITQHIGAYHVQTKGRKVVFIDTPGHQAFTRMRARGAQATDIVVLVVAADDGVMPQTLEAVDHAKAAKVPIVVAINKIDKPGAQPDKIKQVLSDRCGLMPEDWGGETIMVPVSAKVGTNVDTLLEMLLLVAEMQEFKANPKRTASGVILEARMDRGRGTVATVLVQNGTLKVGDTFIAGNAYGKVRAMYDDRGDSLKEAEPSSAVEVLGLQGIPQAGDAFQVVDDTTKAREMVEFRLQKQREMDLAQTTGRVGLEGFIAQMQAGETKELAIVLKADTQGSVEVLEDTLSKLSTEKVKINFIFKGVGAISESDIDLASASRAIVIGFNVRPEASARALAEKAKVEIRLYSVIYDISREIEQAMLGLLAPTIRERYLGRAEVRDTFRIPKAGTVAGCYIQDGAIPRSSQVRLLRDNVVVYEGRLASLRRFKDDVAEVRSGYECGMGIANFNDIKVGDVIEAYAREEVAPQLN